MSTKEVSYPKPDEIVVVTVSAGQTIEFGFNPTVASFSEVDGDLIAVLPNGGMVILEDYESAAVSDQPPTLLYQGEPLSTGGILTTNDQELGLEPASEPPQTSEDSIGSGTSAYDEDLDSGLTEGSILESQQSSSTTDTDQTFDSQTEATATTEPASSGEDTTTPSNGKQGKGFGKGGKKKQSDDDGAVSEFDLSNNTVPENSAGAELVGVVGPVDPTNGDSFTYELLDDADGRFAIDSATGAVTVTNREVLDHEAADSHDITVQMTDGGGNSNQETFTIYVDDVNEAPTDILFGTSIDENAPNDTLIKVAVAVDPDDGERFTYELVDNAGGRFAIDGVTGAVTVADGDALDHEAADSHDITIRVTDSGGISYQEAFTIHVDDVNEAPRSLGLDGDTVMENSAVDSLVGTVSATDPDEDDSVTFRLIDDAGGRFTIDETSGQIRVANGGPIDFETSASHSLTVRATDRGGLVYDETFVITVQDVAEGGGDNPPTAIALDNLNVDENSTGAVIGQISVSDADTDDVHSLAVDDGRFEVVGNLLRLKPGVSLDFEQEGQVTLQLTATDSDGLNHSETFTLTVVDGNDLPEASDNQASVHFESTGGTPVLKLWEDDFSGNWEDRWSLKYIGGEERTELFEYGGETWIRVTYPEGQERTGVGFATSTAPQERMYLEYKLRFAEDFDWVLGGKLPGLSGGTANSGNAKPDGTDGWSVRFMWREGGKVVAYVYHPDQPHSFGEDFSLGNFSFEAGVVQTLGLEVVMNTPGQYDGIVRAWLDGVMVVEETNIRFRDVPDLQIDGFVFSTFFGGSGDQWAPTKEETIEFGDFKIYSAPPSEGGELISADPATLDVVGDDSDQDGDELRVSDLDQPNSGTVIDNGDGTVTYQPDEGFSLYDSFSYAVSDGEGGTSTAQIRIWDDSLNSISGTSIGDTLNGTSGGDYIAGGDGDDDLYGDAGRDVLYGGAGSDYMDGGEGDDVLIGGLGADTMDVGQGTDLLIYENVLDAGDVIVGFNAAEGHDFISLDRLFDQLDVATAERDDRIAVEKNDSVHTLRIDTSGDGVFDLTLATVHVVNGEILNITQENGDVAYGTL